MGERIAIAFVRESYEEYRNIVWNVPREISVVLWSHWGDKAFLRAVKAWMKRLPEFSDDDPKTRREPSALVVELLRSKVGNPVDNIFQDWDHTPMPDHGFWEIDCLTGKAKEVLCEEHDQTMQMVSDLEVEILNKKVD